MLGPYLRIFFRINKINAYSLCPDAACTGGSGLKFRICYDEAKVSLFEGRYPLFVKITLFESLNGYILRINVAYEQRKDPEITPCDHDPELARAKERIGRVFKYIRALHARRTSPILDFHQHPWYLLLEDLVPHPAIKCQKPGSTSKISGDDQFGFELSVGRPVETLCPPPPPAIRDWLVTGWELIDSDPLPLESRNFTNIKDQVKTERFDKDGNRILALESWLEERREWIKGELPTRGVISIFSRLFDLYGRMGREAEKYQLWLADGHLQWKFGSNVVRHPLVLQKVEIQFDPKIPEFRIVESSEPPELHAAILRYCDLEGRRIHEIAQSLRESPCHPLGEVETNGFLKQLVNIFWENGEFIPDGTNDVGPPSEKPVILRRPMLFLGSRTQGFDSAMERIQTYLSEATELPESLMRLVGLDVKRQKNEVNQTGSGGFTQLSGHGDGLSLATSVMLTKAANEEQVRVIQKLTESGSVIVQGPPGTGKTHTIANLVGHLLAEGKTVLVTSHTSKALRVVREKVHDSLRSLCVSVLDSDEDSRRELEESISGIVGYLSRTDRGQLESVLRTLDQRRQSLLDLHNSLVRQLLSARRGEYDDIIYGGHSVSPSNAARFISEHPQHAWIPGPVIEGAALPLSQEEVLDLYATNLDVPEDVDRTLAHQIPDLNDLPNEGQFAELVAELDSLTGQIDTLPPIVGDVLNLNELLIKAKSLAEFLGKLDPWLQEPLLAGLAGGTQRDIWLGLSELLRTNHSEILARRELILKYGPSISESASKNNGLGLAIQIAKHLESGVRNFL